MPKSIIHILKKLFFVISFFYSAIYVIACFTPYINPIHFFPLVFLSLGFPFLLFGMLLLIIMHFFIYRKYSWIFVCILLLGFKNITSTFGFHPKKEFVWEKQPNTLRLLSWNVNYFLDCQIKNDTPNNPRKKMFEFIKKTNADVLCFQDFSSFYNPKLFYPNLEYIRDSLHYPYTYFPIAFVYNQSWAPEKYGVVFFSRYPITDTARIWFVGDVASENFGYADINFLGKSIRFYTAHLRSMQLHAQKFNENETGFLKADTALILHSNTFRKLKYFDKVHIEQAKLIRKSLDTSRQPFVFCGDINAVPSSYVYATLSKNLNDAFLANGSGFGRTYDSLSPTLRIDVVLMNKQIHATQFYTPRLHLSDHLPNVVDLKFQ